MPSVLGASARVGGHPSGAIAPARNDPWEPMQPLPPTLVGRSLTNLRPSPSSPGKMGQEILPCPPSVGASNGAQWMLRPCRPQGFDRMPGIGWSPYPLEVSSPCLTCGGNLASGKRLSRTSGAPFPYSAPQYSAR